MPWSTREIAELAGTSVNTVRYYHRSGLLDEPGRTSNGYKQYGARHLVRLLQVRRLRDLGVPLAQIETVGFGGGPPTAALLAIDADLTASIERLQRTRAEIRATLDGSSAIDVPSGFEDVASRLSDPDRSLLLVYSRLYNESAMTDVKRMIESEPEPDGASAAFDTLPADADDATRQLVAETLAPKIAQHLVDYPWVMEPVEHVSKGQRVTREAVTEALKELYNAAQVDVLGRASAIAQERLNVGQ
ncbi:MerR family transcriptional regulator [Cryobacterium lactosi]|jgi:DNA-binding transcriptional MerR regulator|uniref:MerR family transcriptional regulator n=1 Tax=Cryobacterium lactosi TaxID=1259202 RepID=A0A4R9BYI0_9MICO|nr:MerR family transcriptional regulator [Cryobacterium lactosi]TFD92102.1 MerR family transcriptional regulator [Cryobacterium lactosi]